MLNNDLPTIIKALITQYGEDAVKFEVRHSINRGTHGGYCWHQYNKSIPCDDCKIGEAEYQAERWRTKNSLSSNAQEKHVL